MSHKNTFKKWLLFFPSSSSFFFWFCVLIMPPEQKNGKTRFSCPLGYGVENFGVGYTSYVCLPFSFSNKLKTYLHSKISFATKWVEATHYYFNQSINKSILALVYSWNLIKFKVFSKSDNFVITSLKKIISLFFFFVCCPFWN